MIVIKKLEGLEKELKVDKDILDFIEKKFPFKFNICFQLLAYSESLTDQVAFPFSIVRDEYENFLHQDMIVNDIEKKLDLHLDQSLFQSKFRHPHSASCAA